MVANPQQFLRDLFSAAVSAADPMLCVPKHLPDVPGYRRVVVVGAGKAAATMAKAWERWAYRCHVWPDPRDKNKRNKR